MPLLRCSPIVLISITFLLLISCQSYQKDFTLATSSKGGAYMQVGSQIARTLKDNGYSIKLLTDRRNETLYNCKLVATGQADLALVQNDTPVEKLLKTDSIDTQTLRAVMPLYPEILFIIYPDSLNPRNLRELIAHKRIGMGPEGSGTARLIKALFKNYGIYQHTYTPVHTSFEENRLSNPAIDVSISVTSFNNPKIAQMITNGGKIFSLDDPERIPAGSSVDGFCINYPRARPFIIPRFTYTRGPENPILTIAVDALLITHTGVDANSIYQLVSTFYRNIQKLSNMNPSLSLISENFNPVKLNFPLHTGTRMYLTRDEPTFFERYAEIIGLIITISVVIAGSVSSFHRYTERKKKERIDGYYRILLDTEKKLPFLNSLKALHAQLTYLSKLKAEALEKVIEEKLAADESFRIFMEQANYVIQLLKEKQGYFEKKEAFK